MAVINEISITDTAVKNMETAAQVRAMVSERFWTWYALNLGRKITSVSFWFFRKTVYVRDLHPLFVMLFGPQDPE